MAAFASLMTSRTLLAAPPAHVPPACAYVVGFSGGLDSTVLLHALARAHPGRVRALHVHHGLQAEADDWARHCEAVCRAWQIPLAIERIQVIDVDAGPEAAARAARHAAFAAALQADEWLVLGQHRDDQAETFLLRALRGAGPEGLASMRPVRPFPPGLLWRPLLETARDALLAYAQAHALPWIEDPSNAHDAFDRNFLRNAVMPLLRQRWPQADAAFARAATLQGDVLSRLQAEDGVEFAALPASHPLPLSCWRERPSAQRAPAFRAWISALGLPPMPARGVDWLQAELAKAPNDGASEFHWAGQRLRRWRDALHVDDGLAALDAGFCVDWNGREAVRLPNGLCWQLQGAASFDTPMHVRARAGGERMRRPGRQHRHLLKHLWQDESVPPWQRAAMPLLFAADGELLAAGDLHSAPLHEWLTRHDAQLVLKRPSRD